jgi:hypothetical protein
MKVWYHHIVPFHRVKYDVIVPVREYSDDQWFIPAYEWLHDRLGFWPLFVAVGIPSDVSMTGYQSNWRRFLGGTFQGKRYNKIYVKKGEAPNYVLFSFRHVEGVFTDYMSWHFVLGARGNRPQEDVTDNECRQLFKKSWPRSRWLHKARKERSEVQLIAPSLDLRTACRIWCRNKATKKALEKMGFRNVRVKRIPVN